MQSKIKLLIILTIGVLLPVFCNSQTLSTAKQTPGPPSTTEELKSTLWKAVKFIPDTIIKAGKWFIYSANNIWNSYFYPFFHKIWQKIESIFGKEIEERTPVIKEEFKKETQEIKQEVPSVFKSVWEKIRSFFK